MNKYVIKDHCKSFLHKDKKCTLGIISLKFNTCIFLKTFCKHANGFFFHWEQINKRSYQTQLAFLFRKSIYDVSLES